MLSNQRKEGDAYDSLMATVPKTVKEQRNMEVLRMDALFIQAVIVLIFMYRWLKDNDK